MGGKKYHDLSGQVFGSLTVLTMLPRQPVVPDGKRVPTKWMCQCTCGKVKQVMASNLTGGKSRSCGCVNITHGLKKDPLYQTWNGIRQRCFNPVTPNYQAYGGRGVTMDPIWSNDFKAFRDWVLENLGERPSVDHSIDRIDTIEGCYAPGAIRWATRVEQANNTRSNVRLEFTGRTQTLADWCREMNLSYSTVSQRLRKLGWTVEQALTIPTDGTFSRKVTA